MWKYIVAIYFLVMIRQSSPFTFGFMKAVGSRNAIRMTTKSHIPATPIQKQLKIAPVLTYSINQTDLDHNVDLKLMNYKIGSGIALSMDIKDTKTHYEIVMDIPGVDKKDIHMNLWKGYLNYIYIY